MSHPTRPLVAARAARAFADGFASVLLARYLQHLGFSGWEIGVVVTATLLGSAVLTVVAGLRLSRYGIRPLLLWSCALMALTGVGFGTVTAFAPLVVIAFVGTLNPSGGDVSVFLPTEQAVLADLTDTPDRPYRFAVYNLAGALAGAAGALASVAPERVARAGGWEVVTIERVSFLVYVIVAIVAARLYATMRDALTSVSLHRGAYIGRGPRSSSCRSCSPWTLLVAAWLSSRSSSCTSTSASTSIPERPAWCSPRRAC